MATGWDCLFLVKTERRLLLFGLSTCCLHPAFHKREFLPQISIAPQKLGILPV